MAHPTREQILVACAREIAANGLRGFRMQNVARAAGVSIGLLSYHFGDRDGLLQAALDHVNESAAGRATASTGSLDAAARLEAILCSEFGDDDEIREGSIAWNELRAAAVFDAAGAAAVSRSTATWQASIRRLIAEHRATDADAASVETTALTLTALVEGLSGRWLTGQIDAATAQQTVRSALDVFALGPNRDGNASS